MEFRKEDFAEASALWAEWNSKINVVSRKDIDSLFEHHILHSLAIARYLEGEDVAGDSFIDVGTGGGFPGVPLAMALPECSFTLCDSIRKKIKVASAVSEGLGLKNVKCLNCRAEDIKEEFDWVVSRAVTSLSNFYPWVRGKYRKGILYLKGGDVEAEISELCARCRIDRSKISVQPISDWTEDEYYKEKYVVRISR